MEFLKNLLQKSDNSERKIILNKKQKEQQQLEKLDQLEKLKLENDMERACGFI